MKVLTTSRSPFLSSPFLMPLILCESRSLAGVLNGIAARYGCPIAATNGQTKGFLVSKVAPALELDQRVLYLGD